MCERLQPLGRERRHASPALRSRCRRACDRLPGRVNRSLDPRRSPCLRLTALLFGNVLGVDHATLGVLAILGALCLAGLAAISRPLLFATLQPDLAEARGVGLRLVSVLFLAVVALATAACAQIVGVLLVFSLLVGPAATAQRLTPEVGRGLALSVALALAEAWLGIALAWWTDWPASFWITALSGAAFLLAVLATRTATRGHDATPAPL